MKHKKRLYSTYEGLSSEGDNLDQMTTNAIRPIIEDFAKRGYSLRDIDSIMKASVDMQILLALIEHREINEPKG